MEFRILGPLYADAGTGGGPAVIKQPLLQSALAVLLLRANRPCPRGMLIDALWGGEPPGSPEAALRVCISRLRRCLGDCATRLDSVGPPGGRAPGHRQQRGYLMTVRPGELDVDEFTDLAEQGQAELDAGNAAAAAAALVHALALWGDPPLPDLPDSDVIAADVARLINLRQAAMDALVEARLVAGETEGVLAQLRSTVTANPARERSCDQLMRAYHALGMRKEALEVYQLARRAMREQQGAEPGQALAVLYKRILAEEMAAESAAHLSTISLTTPLLLGWQAPAPPADFVGRQAEIAAITGQLAGPSVPVTVVTGPPGAGKTAIAAAAALGLREHFRDGQLYAELGGVEHPRDPQDVLADMLRAMGIPARSVPPPGPPRAAMYRSLLAGRRVLVIADDAAAAGQVRPLIPAASGAAVLVTSRGRLSGLAGAAAVEVPALPDDDALALLALAAGPGRVDTSSGPALAVIRACDGLPLAVRLAAVTLAAVPGLSVAELARQVQGGRVLDVLAAEDVSVRAAIGSSYRALGAAARAALAMAADMMPGDIPAWALTTLAGGDLGVADRLAAVGLLAPILAAATGRHYRMRPLTRAYCRELGRAERGDSAAVARLRAGWLHRADVAAARLPAVPFVPAPTTLSPGQSVSAAEPALEQAWLEGEYANLAALVEHACVSGAHQDAAALASRLTAHQFLTGRYADAARSWRAIGQAAAAAGDNRSAARATYCLAAALVSSRDHVGDAVQLLRRCLPALRQLPGPDPAALAYCLLASCASAAGQHAGAIRMARRAIALTEERPGADLVRCSALTVLGLTLARVGMCDSGARYCRDARADARDVHQQVYESHTVMALAQVLMLSGDYGQAASVCEDGIRLAGEYRSAVDVARFGLVLGWARQRDHDHLGAAVSLRASAEVFRASGLVLDETTARSLLAACRLSAGDASESATQVALVSEILVRSGIGNASALAEKALAACGLAGTQPTTAGRYRLKAG